MNIQNFIIKNLLTKSKKINARRCNKEWFFKNNFKLEYNEIIRLTSFIENQSFGFRIKSVYNNIFAFPLCSNGNNVSINNNEYNDTCSDFSCKCILDKKKQTKKERYGDENYNNREKISETKLLYTNEKRDSINKKSHLTKKERYGDENYNNRDKCKSTKKERYGDENYVNIEKAKETNISKYSVNSFNKQHYSADFLDLIHNKNQFEQEYNLLSTVGIAKKYNVAHSTVNNYRKIFKIKLKSFSANSSKAEKEVVDFIKSIYSDTIIENDRSVLEGKELDIYLPKLNIAIEYNGLYWHGSSSNDDRMINKNNHLNKTEACEAKGIQLFHIFENEWIDPDKQKIWKSMIKNKLGLSNRIYARKCEIREVDTKEAREFCINNHMQGYSQASIKYGLYYNDELMSLITISKSRYCIESTYEIIRFCNKLNVSVVGGFSKLLKHFRTLYKGMIVSYANRRWSTGGLYEQNGFNNKENTVPNYWYFKLGNVLESRLKYQKHKLYKIFDNFNAKISEYENMFNNGYSVIYDSGNIKYNLI